MKELSQLFRVAGLFTRNSFFSLLYVGGVRSTMYGKLPNKVLSTFGYQGCLASIDLNGEAADPINNALIPSSLVAEGCEGKNCVCSIQEEES